jgi:MarR family transcriptional regulator, transcriptional regulator for hemolysin
MSSEFENNVPVGTKALIFSKWYYGVLSKNLENIDTDRYYSVLYFLHYHNGCCQQHICNNLAIDKTAMVKVIDHLIKKGLVDRNVNPNDRREHFIVLTKKGSKQSEEIVKAFQAIDDKIFSSVTKQERQLFEKVLSTLSVNLKDLPSNDLFFNYKKTARKRAKNSSFSLT